MNNLCSVYVVDSSRMSVMFLLSFYYVILSIVITTVFKVKVLIVQWKTYFISYAELTWKLYQNLSLRKISNTSCFKCSKTGSFNVLILVGHYVLILVASNFSNTGCCFKVLIPALSKVSILVASNVLILIASN